MYRSTLVQRAMKPRAPAVAGPLAGGSCIAFPRSLARVAFGRSRQLSVSASANQQQQQQQGSDQQRSASAAAPPTETSEKDPNAQKHSIKASNNDKPKKRAPSAYNEFIKKTIPELRKDEPGLKPKEAMTKAAHMYKQHKAEKKD